MESRRKVVPGKRAGSLKQKNAAEQNAATPAFSLPNIAQLITDGEITVGRLAPVGCVAIASDGHNSLAMLKRRKGETLVQLLTRLDQAIDRAWAEDVFTDEINTPPSYSSRP